MALGQVATLSGLGLSISLALELAGVDLPLAFAVPLMLLGLGHGFLMPACLAGSVSLIPGHGSLELGLLMLALTLLTLIAQLLLHRR